MGTDAKRAAVEKLWREALQTYRDEGLQGRLTDGWPADRNVDEGISYEYPPTFQPGYVGPRYLAMDHRIVLVGEKPGEGSDPTSVRMNREYQDKLEAFTRGEVGFKELNSLIASHMLRWLMFDGKGIFRESDARRISLVDEDLRLPIEDISYVNYFPFKTSANRSPFKASSFRGYVWATYIRSLLELLEPTVIIPMGSWYAGSTTTEFRRLAGSPKLIPVWNPSDYNLNTRPWELLTKWEPVSEYLRGLRGSSHH